MVKSDIESIAENLMSIYPQLYKTLSKPMRTKTSVTPGGLFVLGALKRVGIMSMTDIGKKLSIPKPHVTVIVDKLTDEGYVIRKSDPHDRRIVNIELTESGLDNFEDIKLVISESLKIKLMTLSEEERKLLLVSSKNIKDILISVLSKED
jgi:MarR family transcriptional regulator, 2-MHQ and catechol-resistance regulon repressor